MSYDQNREVGWSAVKCGVFWLGGIIMLAIIGVVVVLVSASLNKQNVVKWDACLDSGATALECKAAVYGS